MVECKCYDVLVRDNTVNNLRKSEDVVKVKYHSVKDAEELNRLMLNKLNTSVTKLTDNAKETGKFRIEDIVDVQEILDKIKHEAPYDRSDYQIAQEKRAVHNGRFDLNMVLDYMERKF